MIYGYARCSTNEQQQDINRQVRESDLYNKLAAIHAIDGTGKQQPVTVTGIYWPEEFSVLEGRQVTWMR